MRRLSVILVYAVFLAASVLCFFFLAVPALEHSLANLDQPDWVPPPILSGAEKAAIYLFFYPFVFLFGPPGCILNIVLIGAIPAWLVLWFVRRRPLRRAVA